MANKIVNSRSGSYFKYLWYVIFRLSIFDIKLLTNLLKSKSSQTILALQRSILFSFLKIISVKRLLAPAFRLSRFSTSSEARLYSLISSTAYSFQICCSLTFLPAPSWLESNSWHMKLFSSSPYCPCLYTKLKCNGEITQWRGMLRVGRKVARCATCRYCRQVLVGERDKRWRC
jgi:hypothetical protein